MTANETIAAQAAEIAALRANFEALARARKAEYDAQAAEIAYLNGVIDELRKVRDRLARKLQHTRADTPPMAAMEAAYGDDPRFDPVAEVHPIDHITIDLDHT